MYNNNKKNIVIIQMANFQRITIIVAGVLLLIFVIILSYVLYKTSSSEKWPPVIPSCPDYWISNIDLSNNTVCSYDTVNNYNVGSCSNVNNKIVSNLTSCDKYNWATNCGIVWDVITYGVTNPCNAPATTTTTTTTSS